MSELENPKSRNESLLTEILNDGGEYEAPKSRNEKIMVKILGGDIEIEQPKSRIEKLLIAIKEKIDSMGGGGGAVPEKDVNFYDMDASLVASYTAEEFAALSEMPANPEHEGLIAEGWNYTLEEAKTYVSKYGGLDIGQFYKTDDGTTRIHINLTEGYKNITCAFVVREGTASIDWGDGSPKTTDIPASSGHSFKYSDHEYSSAGDYVIKISGKIELAAHGSVGCYLITTKSTTESYCRIATSTIKKVEVGENATFYYPVFSGARNLEILTIPKEVKLTTGLSQFFNSCYSLKALTLPDFDESISNKTTENMISDACNLERLSLPKNTTTIGYFGATNGSKLSSLAIPQGVTTISGSLTFKNSLKKLYIPDTVTTISANQMLQSNKAMKKLVIPDSVTTCNDTIVVSCEILREIKLSKNCTTALRLQGCAGIDYYEIPANVESVGSCANAYSLAIIKCLPTTPPTLSANAFSGAYKLEKIYVPDESVDAYKAASNWSTYASKIFGLSELA